MNKEYRVILKKIESKRYKWLITGVAGFIGSNLLEKLLKMDQIIIGIDNLSTGSKKNLLEVKNQVTKKQWANFKFYKLDITNFKKLKSITKGIDFVLHQAALGSVPRSIKNPLDTNNSNVVGFLNILYSSSLSKVKCFVYASSSATYGDHIKLPKIETKTGNLLSPYAATKFINEIYADIFSRIYKIKCVGLRYFNVFGQRQDPNGTYAAVIPKWINSMIQNKTIKIFGDGKTSRDFCFIDNVVCANLLASFTKQKKNHEVYNIAASERTSLNKLFNEIKDIAYKNGIKYSYLKKKYYKFRDGDIKHSLANINKAKKILGYKPLFFFSEGLSKTFEWYKKKSKRNV